MLLPELFVLLSGVRHPSTRLRFPFLGLLLRRLDLSESGLLELPGPYRSAFSLFPALLKSRACPVPAEILVFHGLLPNGSSQDPTLAALLLPLVFSASSKFVEW